MSWWPWRKRVTPDPELSRAKQEFEQNRAAARGAVVRLAAATAAEQDQIRRNHLGQLMHDALIARRHP